MAAQFSASEPKRAKQNGMDSTGFSTGLIPSQQMTGQFTASAPRKLNWKKRARQNGMDSTGFSTGLTPLQEMAGQFSTSEPKRAGQNGIDSTGFSIGLTPSQQMTGQFTASAPRKLNWKKRARQNGMDSPGFSTGLTPLQEMGGQFSTSEPKRAGQNGIDSTGFSTGLTPSQQMTRQFTASAPRKLNWKKRARQNGMNSTESQGSFVGQTVSGVLNGSFDAGFLLTVKVGNTDTVMQGFVFKEGLSTPITEANDIAPNVKFIRRDDTVRLPSKRPPRKRKAKTVDTPLQTSPTSPGQTSPISTPASPLIVHAPAQSSPSTPVFSFPTSAQTSPSTPVFSLPTSALFVHAPGQTSGSLMDDPEQPTDSISVSGVRRT